MRIFNMTAPDIIQDNFRPEFKRYKSKTTPPSFQDIVDMDRDVCDKNGEFNMWKIPDENLTAALENLASSIGLQPLRSWRCYAANGFPGLQFIRNPFTQGWQRYWVKRCIADYPCKPNTTNLDAHMGEACVHSPWHASQQTSSVSKEKTAMDQLRWVTLGYHYDWNNKVYHQNRHSPFPEDLSLVSAVIAAVLGYQTFQSQAAIINFYHMDSTLGGHTDHSEFDLSAPLISYSLGQSAILLVGGETKATKPVAIHLRSGDIVILGGASRLAYHAVPRIMHAKPGGQLPDCFHPSCNQHAASCGSQERNEANCCAHEISTASLSETNFKNIHKIGVIHDVDESPQKNSGENTSDRHIGSVVQVIPGTTTETFKTTSSTCFRESTSESENICDQQRSSVMQGIEGATSEVDRVAYSSSLHLRASEPKSGSDKVLSCGSLPLLSKCKANTVHSIIGTMRDTMNDLTREEAWTPFEEYLKNARINISVRQVTGPGKGFPDVLTSSDRYGDHEVKTVERKKTKIEDR